MRLKQSPKITTLIIVFGTVGISGDICCSNNPLYFDKTVDSLPQRVINIPGADVGKRVGGGGGLRGFGGFGSFAFPNTKIPKLFPERMPPDPLHGRRLRRPLSSNPFCKNLGPPLHTPVGQQ